MMVIRNARAPNDVVAAAEPAPEAPHGSHRTRQRAIAIWETALVVAGLVGYVYLLPHMIIGDAYVRYVNLLALLDGHTLPDTKYSLYGHLFSAPLIWAARAAGRDQVIWAGMFNSLLFALAIGVSYLLLRRDLPGALLRRFFLLLITASMFGAHVTLYNSEPFTALAVMVGLIAVAARGRSLAGWAAVTLGVANTAAAVPALGLVVATKMWDDRRLRYLLAGLSAIGLLVADNWLRRGDPLASGYENDIGLVTLMPFTGRPGFSYPILLGLLSLCFALGKGLLFFAPGLLLPVRGPMRDLTLGPGGTLYRLYGWWLLFTAGLIVAYAPWWAWYGGLTWGPRFLLFASVPASLALAVRLWAPARQLWQRVLTLVVLALSAWVGFCALVFPEASVPPECVTNGMATEAFCHYTPDFSVLWYPLLGRLELTSEDRIVTSFAAGVFAYLAAPLAESIVRDLAGRLQPPLAGALRGWRW